MLEGKKFDVEHALLMYADSFACLPAVSIYDDAALSPQKEILDKCHIYMIGKMPIVNINECVCVDGVYTVSASTLGKTYDLKWDVPADWKAQEENGRQFLEDSSGRRFELDIKTLLAGVRQHGVKIDFEVQYIGQAYGDEGSRTALERLRKHETLQKIAVEGVEAGYRLEVLMLEPVRANRVVTVFNPRAKVKTEGETRISAGLDKLVETTEKERICLFEAALIRYFKPPYNSKLKDSFPSTNLVCLKQCYDKDFSAVIAEISIDELPYQMFSASVEPKDHHIASHDLHTDADRKVFFSDQK